MSNRLLRKLVLHRYVVKPVRVVFAIRTARLNNNFTLAIYLYILMIFIINSDYFPIFYSHKVNYTKKLNNFK
jgi:hypothetical protein